MMMGLTLYNPHAMLMALGRKRLETRSWMTSYRGLVAIHAAKHSPVEYAALCAREPFRSALRAEDPRGDEWARMHHGTVLAVAELEAARPVTSGDVLRFGHLITPANEEEERAFGNYMPGRFAWRFGPPYKLASPRLMRGRQGLWPIDRFEALAILEAAAYPPEEIERVYAEGLLS